MSARRGPSWAPSTPSSKTARLGKKCGASADAGAPHPARAPQALRPSKGVSQDCASQGAAHTGRPFFLILITWYGSWCGRRLIFLRGHQWERRGTAVRPRWKSRINPARQCGAAGPRPLPARPHPPDHPGAATGGHAVQVRTLGRIGHFFPKMRPNTHERRRTVTKMRQDETV